MQNYHLFEVSGYDLNGSGMQLHGLGHLKWFWVSMHIIYLKISYIAIAKICVPLTSVQL